MIRTLGRWAGFAAGHGHSCRARRKPRRGRAERGDACGRGHADRRKRAKSNYLSYNATYICCFSNDVGARFAIAPTGLETPFVFIAAALERCPVTIRQARAAASSRRVGA